MYTLELTYAHATVRLKSLSWDEAIVRADRFARTFPYRLVSFMGRTEERGLVRARVTSEAGAVTELIQRRV